jgi:hypothetical protein
MTKPSRERGTINDKFRKSLVTRGRAYITAGVAAPGGDGSCGPNRQLAAQRVVQHFPQICA